MLTSNSIAAVNAASIKNVQFVSGATELVRKIGIIGTYEAGKVIADNIPLQSIDPQQTAAKYGFGSMLHRLHLAAQRGSRGVETWIIPQPEEGGAVAATGKITVTVTTAVSGTINLYIAGERVTIPVAVGEIDDDIALNIVDAVNANVNLPITAAIGIATEDAEFTAKTKGTYGNFITITFNWGQGEELPGGVSLAVTDMTGGATDPDIQDALDGTGNNERWFTDIIHGYGQAAATLNALSTYNGAGNDFVGLYEKVIFRPFRSITGDTQADTAGLSALIVIGDGRKLDRTNGIAAVPGSPNHPSEIGATIIGIMARINSNNAAQHYVDEILPGVIPGLPADRWTGDYNNLNLAEFSGISPTVVKNNAVYLLDMLTFYHPDEVASSSNGYRYMVNISKAQNLTNAFRVNFAREEWKQVILVLDASKASENDKARDLDAFIADIVALAGSFLRKAWIADDQFSIDNSTVEFDPDNSNRVNIIFKCVFSGNGRIIDTEVQFDVSFAVLLG